MTGRRLKFGDPAAIEQAYGKPCEHTCNGLEGACVYKLNESRGEGLASIQKIPVPGQFLEHGEAPRYTWAMFLSSEFEDDVAVIITGLKVCPFGCGTILT